MGLGPASIPVDWTSDPTYWLLKGSNPFGPNTLTFRIPWNSPAYVQTAIRARLSIVIPMGRDSELIRAKHSF